MKSKYLREEYIFRINNVIDYIESNLDEDLKLEKLSKVAGFSEFHFHRIFKAIIGETLNHFIQRLRIERAAIQLICNPKKSITEIALDCGFSSPSVFSRLFKNTYKKSASDWRNLTDSKNCKIKSNINQQLRKTGQELKFITRYIGIVNKKQTWRIKMKKNSRFNADVRVDNFEDMTVAYVRHIGPYKGDSKLFEGLYEKLLKWAGPRDLLNFPETKLMSVYHDNPEITDEGKLRTSVCVTVPENTKVDGDIGKMVIPGGKYAVCHFELSTDEFQDAWDAICGGWLPDSGYQPDNRPAFEISLNDPKEHPENKCIVDICVPVKPL